MKRRVRIYKAGGQQGQYINKTSNFLMKAQLGAERSSEEKMMDSISQALAQGMSPEDILAQLVEMGIDQEVAVAAIQKIVESMQPQEEEQEQEVAQEGEEVGNPVLQQYESFIPTQEGEDVEATDAESLYDSSSQLPSLTDYMPEYIPMAPELEVYDINNPFSDMLYAKDGGVVSKRNFVKNVMALVKKQNGGDTEKNEVDSTDIPIDGRKEQFNNFLGAVKGTAQNAILKKAIGNMYNDMMQEGGEPQTTEPELAFTNSKNVTDPYFKYGGLPKAQYGPQNWNEVDDNKNGIPDYLELNYLNQTVKKDESKDKSNDKSKTQSDPSNGRHPLSFIDPIRAQGNRYLNPFGKIFNYDYSYYKPVGANKNMAAIQYDPELMGKPTNVELRRNGRLKEMDMIFDKSNKSNINSITDMKFRRSGVPKSFTINYGAPTATGANPAFDFMLSKYAANKEKQAETPKSNSAPTGPGVAPWADDDQRSRFFRGKEENSKSAKRAMELINEEVKANPVSKRFSFYSAIPATQSTDSYLSEDESGNIEYTPQAKKNLESAKELMETDAATRFNLQSNPEADSFENGYIQPYQFPVSQEYMYGGYYAYGGDLPEYQSQITDTKGSSVTTNPQIQPNLNKAAQTAMDNIMNIPAAKPHIGDGVGKLEPRKLNQVVDDLRDEEGLVNVGNTPKAELEQKQNSIKFKTKNKYNIDPIAALDNFNAAANVGLGFIEDIQSRKANKDQWYNYNADNLYASNNKTDRGTYDVNSGLFRPDEMGFTGVVEYGGTIFQKGGAQDYPNPYNMNPEDLERMNTISDANMRTLQYPTNMETKQAFMRRTGLDKEPWAMTPNSMYSEQRMHGALPGMVRHSHMKYKEGGEAYMTQDEIDDFIANGGELEYLND